MNIKNNLDSENLINKNILEKTPSENEQHAGLINNQD